MNVKAPERSTQTWYRIENRADDQSAIVFLYSEIGMWGITAQEFVNDLRALKASAIEMHINSPGGEVFDGMAIFNAIRNHPAEVTVIVDGIAASAASFIAMAGDRILAERTATIMIHEGNGIAVGNCEDVRAVAELLDKCSDNIASIYAERAGGTVQDWRARMRAETWYSAAEAKAAGLIDDVIGPEKNSRAQPRNDWDLSVFRFAGRAAAPDPFARPTAAMQSMPDMPTEHTMFAVGDRVRVSGTPHEPGQSTGTVALVQPGPAYGIRFDGGGDSDEMDDIHRWYVGDELTSSRRPANVARPTAMVSPAHDTAVTEGTWDADAQIGKMPSPMSTSMAKKMYAWYDAERVEDGMMPKDAGKLPHHEVSSSGMPGAANLAGVRNALARLSQSDIPASDRAAVQAHLRAHLAAGQPADRVEFDPDEFRAAMKRASEVPFDPGEFRDLMQSVAYEAPAPPTSAPRPVDLGPLPEAVQSVSEPATSPWDTIRHAMAVVATTAPAPPDPKPKNPAEEPGFFMDADAFRTALRRATL